MPRSTLTTTDGLRLAFYDDPRPPSPRAVLLWVHGVVEHAGRYGDVAARLASHGIAVYRYDLRGHGHSEGPRVHVTRFDQHVDDLIAISQHARDRSASLPCFVLGHSMGGAIVALALVERQLDASGIILSAPAVTPGSSVLPWFHFLAPLATRLLPKVPLVRLALRYVSRDPAVIDAIRADPLMRHHPTIRTGTEILRAGERILAAASQIEHPLLVLHGTGDRITSPRGSRLLVESVSSTDKGLMEYPGVYHDLFHEPEAPTICQDVATWVLARSGPLP